MYPGVPSIPSSFSIEIPEKRQNIYKAGSPSSVSSFTRTLPKKSKQQLHPIVTSPTTTTRQQRVENSRLLLLSSHTATYSQPCWLGAASSSRACGPEWHEGQATDRELQRWIASTTTTHTVSCTHRWQCGPVQSAHVGASYDPRMIPLPATIRLSRG